MNFITPLSTLPSPPLRYSNSPPRCLQTGPRRQVLKLAALSAAYLLVGDVTAGEGESVSIEDVTVGTGKGFKSGDMIKLHYVLSTGGFTDQGGKVVDASRKRGRAFSYKYDTGSVIKGWDIGVSGMKVGGRRKLVIPSSLGYGARGAGGVIGANERLYFDIELLGVGY